MRNLIHDYWDNFDCTYFGKRWGKDLTVYLEQKMADEECDHSFKYTSEFFSRKFPIKRVFQLWIYNHYCCDCEFLINTNWRDGLDWRDEPEEFKVNPLDDYLIYKDGSKLDLRIYKNGLKEGNILRLRKDVNIENLDGDIVETIAAGTLFKVLPMDYSSWNFGSVQLVSLNDSYSPRCYKDDEKIFEEMEVVDAIEHYKGLIKQYKTESKKISFLYKNLAISYKNENDLDSSLKCFQKAVEVSISESGLNSGSTFLVKKDLANEYFNRENYASAIELFEEALKLNTADQTHSTYEKNFKEKIKIAKKNIEATK